MSFSQIDVPGPKIVYQAARPAGVSLPEFRDRWRAFGELAMSLPLWANIARYDQCDPIPELGDAHRIQIDDIGGVGMIWFRSPEHMSRLSTSTDLQIMRDAEIEVFGKLNEGELLTAETRVSESDRTQVELIAFLRRSSKLSAEQFQSLISPQQRGRMSSRDSCITREIHDRVIEPDGGPEMVVELGFSDINDLADALDRSGGLEEVLGIDDGLLDRPRCAVTAVRRNVLFDGRRT